ncbi:MAG: UvrD-helicase domain-containing protein [Clostridia bacterium]|nr:UvrD-helicase domain-containing protein [Clostridia bacterium]
MSNQKFITAKRNLFDKLFDNLNEKQREAVFTVKGPLLILAGAGSGKTTVLVNRIGYMIRYGNAYLSEETPEWVTDEHIAELENALTLPKEEIETVLDKYAVAPIPAWSILSITFTNKAANEMKQRLEKRVGDKAAEIWAGTFHSICVRLLRRFGDRLGYAQGFTIYDTDDQKKLIVSVLKDTNTDDKMFQPKSVMNFISSAKDRLKTPSEVASECKDFRETKMAELYKEYQKRLKTANAVDFDDIIMQTVALLQQDGEVLSYCQNRFKYVLVDEYQDTNHAQFVLTKMIAEKHRNLMVVGDDDQSIYRFRGADIENILNFDRELPDAKVIKLEQNYRSTKSILDTANAIIKNNTSRHGKSLWTDKEGGAKVFLRRLDTQNDEAKFIVDAILAMKQKEGRSLNDFAVLYRINALSNSLEGAFARSGIPYRILGGLRFYERKEIKDILAYLCVINNPCDNIRLMRIINEPKRKIGDSTINAVYELANYYEESMFDILARAELYPSLAKAQSKLKDFANLILGLREIAAVEPIDVLIDKVLDLTGYREMLRVNSEDEGETRLENVNELISNAVEFMSSHDDCSLNAFLEEVSLVSDIDNYDPEAEAVVLMTVHSAKGLEFPVVFLPALEDGIFPSQQSIYEPAELEEERRLAYVAVTRAKQKLYITHARERLMFGKTSYNHLSKFVSEIPEELLDRPQSEVERSKYRAGDIPRPMSRKPQVSEEMMKKPMFREQTRTAVREIFSPGDVVVHDIFGEGMILSAKSVGPDILYEIAFDNVGTKKMMGTYAKIKRRV